MILAFNVEILIVVLCVAFAFALAIGIIAGVLLLLNEETKRVCRNCTHYDTSIGCCWRTYKKMNKDGHCNNYCRRI